MGKCGKRETCDDVFNGVVTDVSGVIVESTLNVNVECRCSSLTQRPDTIIALQPRYELCSTHTCLMLI